MNLGLQMLSLSRPLSMLVVLALYMTRIDRDFPTMALLTFSAGFFVASTSVVVGWIPAPVRWRTRVLWAELALVLILNLVSARYPLTGAMSILFVPVVVAAFMILERRQWRLFLSSLFGGWILSSIPSLVQLDLFEQVTLLGLYGGLLLFGAGAGILIRSLTDERERSLRLVGEIQAARAALERSHRQLQGSLARQQEAVVLEERQRLAREIHDGVAHSLTALVVQLQAVRRTLDRAPEQAPDLLTRCEQMAREALQETRRAVRALHPAGLEQQSDYQALSRLARDFSIATEITVEVVADEAGRSLPADPSRVENLYRILQEALTNAHRHGRASKVWAELRRTEEGLRLVISNNGLRPSGLDRGLGLTSMAERAEALGGRLRAEPGEQGVNITVDVPIREEALR